jgi:hypothetical protein
VIEQNLFNQAKLHHYYNNVEGIFSLCFSKLWEMMGLGFVILDWVSGGEMDLEKRKRCEESVGNKRRKKKKKKT